MHILMSKKSPKLQAHEKRGSTAARRRVCGITREAASAWPSSAQSWPCMAAPWRSPANPATEPWWPSSFPTR